MLQRTASKGRRLGRFLGLGLRVSKLIPILKELNYLSATLPDLRVPPEMGHGKLRRFSGNPSVAGDVLVCAQGNERFNRKEALGTGGARSCSDAERRASQGVA